MTTPIDQAAEVATKAFYLADTCRADWEATVNLEAIAKAMVAESIDVHHELAAVSGLLQDFMERALVVLANDDAVAALGERLGCNLSWEAWQDNWWNAYLGGDGNAH